MGASGLDLRVHYHDKCFDGACSASVSPATALGATLSGHQLRFASGHAPQVYSGIIPLYVSHISGQIGIL